MGKDYTSMSGVPWSLLEKRKILMVSGDDLTRTQNFIEDRHDYQRSEAVRELFALIWLCLAFL